MEEGLSLVLPKSGAIISDMSADTMPLSDMPAYTVQLYQTYMLGSLFRYASL